MKLSKERLKEIVKEELEYLQIEAVEDTEAQKRLRQVIGSVLTQIQSRLKPLMNDAQVKKIAAAGTEVKGQLIVGILQMFGVSAEDIVKSISAIRGAAQKSKVAQPAAQKTVAE